MNSASYSGSSIPIGYADPRGLIYNNMKRGLAAYNRAEAEREERRLAQKANAAALLEKLKEAKRKKLEEEERERQMKANEAEGASHMTSRGKPLSLSRPNNNFTFGGGRRRTIRRKRANRKTRRRA